MPARRKRTRTGPTDFEAAAVWEDYFWNGEDFFSDLPALGIHTEKAARAAAPAAWRRYGAQVLAKAENRDGHVPWALTALGPPPTI